MDLQPDGYSSSLSLFAVGLLLLPSSTPRRFKCAVVFAIQAMLAACVVGGRRLQRFLTMNYLVGIRGTVFAGRASAPGRGCSSSGS